MSTFNVGTNYMYDIDSNIGSISQEDIYPPHFDVERKYRGASSQKFHLPLTLNSNAFGNQVDFELDASNKLVNNHLYKNNHCSYKVSFTKYNVPDSPLYLVPTHFIVNTCIDGLVSRLHDTLGQMSGISCEFLDSVYEWNGVYRKGSSYCKFQVHIYSDRESYIVEVNRLSGDAIAFKCIYTELKEILNDPYKVAEESFASLSLTDVSPHLILSDNEIDGSLKPIMAMATSPLLDSQREATFTICNLSSHDDMQQPLCDNGFINILVGLINSSHELVRQYAIFALGNLSTSPSCQEVMLSSGIVKIVLDMTDNGPYQSAEIRREGVRILANLASRHSEKILTLTGDKVITSWFEKVENVQDDRLKIHASNAKEYLTMKMAIKT